MIEVPGYTIKEKLIEGAFFSSFKAERTGDRKPVLIILYKIPSSSVSKITKFKSALKIKENLLENIVSVFEIKEVFDGTAVVLEDFDGVPLTEILDDVKGDLNKFLNISVQVANALEDLHAKNIIHENIRPGNILINKKGKVKVTNFITSPAVTGEIKNIYDKDVIENILPYISPEQTGRMNRDVDYRTDFYSLGIVFYEMLTGKKPFVSGDPLELIHSHIAREPKPLIKLSKEIPEVVSDIAEKLLEKTQEERYQSGYGLKYDLEKCMGQFKKAGEIKNFKLGEKDVSREFHIPQKLYGREKETEGLMDSFESISTGKSEMMMVTGYPGIGKTVLVREIYKPVLEKKGYFISGKYDQYTRNVPYNAVIQAFHDLIKQILSESEERIKLWREKILEAVGSSGQIIIDIIPEVELIIGKQLPVPKLGPTESQNRFNMVFQKFVCVFTAKEHPLVLFLDDLQWVDIASLNLMKNLITDPETRYLYIIGAYRSNEVSASHPLMLVLDEIKKTEAVVNTITLQPIGKKYVNQLIADTLSRNAEETGELSDLIYKKTEGNPFFVKQFLAALHEEKMLWFDETHTWQWDMNKISRMPVTDNVTDLMVDKINKLSPATRELLRIASCIGGRFDPETLSAASGKTEEEMFSDLNESVSEGLILTFNGIYGFSHDRIQEAAYSLVPDNEKIQIHYEIGSSVLKSTKKEDLIEKIFFICDQLDSGRELITGEREKLELAGLNLTAGKRAKESNAYASAVKYLKVGMELLPDECWQKQYELTYSLYLERAECEYLNMNFEEAEKLFDEILNNAESKLDKANIYELKAILYTHENKKKEAVKTGIAGLRLLGVKVPLGASKIAIMTEVLKAKWNQGRRKTEDLINLPESVAPKEKIISTLLQAIGASAYYTSKDLYVLIILKMVNASLKYGNTEVSSPAYATYGMVLGGALSDYKSGYEFGRLALNLGEKFNNISARCKSIFVMGCFINPWRKHLKTSNQYLMKSYQYGMESGELMFAAYCLGIDSIHEVVKGDYLDDVNEQAKKYLEFLTRTKNYNEANECIVSQRMALNLKGLTKNKYSFSDDNFDEEEFVKKLNERNFEFGIYWYYLIKLQVFYIFENYIDAYKMAMEAEKIIESAFSAVIYAEHYLYYSLTLTALYPTASSAEKKNYLKILNSNQKKMRKWADNCPENFLHKYLLIAAEMARITGKDFEAMELYDKAAKSAGENEYIQNEAIAYELAGKFYLERGRDKIAKTYMTEAREGYLEWGATAKVKDLEEKYLELLGKAASEGAEVLDLKTVLKASQTISGEILLNKLLGRLMHIMIENAGAEKGFLIMEKNNELFIEAEGIVDEEEVEVRQSIPVESSNALSAGVVNYVKRTRETLVLDDAARVGEFTSDSYIKKNQIKSILCVPIVKQAELLGVLYLENNLTANAFTPDRVGVLNVLCSQAAISLENAILYDELDLRVKERTAELAKANAALKKAMDELKEVDRMKDEFFSSVTHEIRNPLTPVRLQSQLLLRSYFGELTEKQKESVETILKNTNRIIRLTDDIMTISKMRAGVLKYEMTENDLVDVIENSVNNMEFPAKEKKIAVIRKYPESFLVKCDKDRINQVIENLIGNAIKFTPENGKITVEAKRIKNDIVVSVEDTGIGISKENQGKLFGAFFQVSSKYGGTGLGLTICSSIIKEHHGKIWVESESGKGSKFSFSLPAIQK